MSRRFGLLQATALNMSNMLGAGPFITIPTLMAALMGPQSMLGWLVALVITMADGLVWSELGAAMPGSGGTYGWLRVSFGKTWGPLMTFLFVWQFVLSGPMEVSTAYMGFGQYLNYLWPGASALQAKLAGATMGLLVIALLWRKIDGISRLMVALWIGVIITMGSVILSGLSHFDAGIAFAPSPEPMRFTWGMMCGLGAAARTGVYDFLGYYDVCYIGDEVKQPGQVIPRSVLISLGSVALIYVATNLAIVGVLPWQSLASDPTAPVAAMVMEKVHGKPAAQLFTLLILWTVIASAVALMLGYSRILFAAARDGNFFCLFAKLHPTGAFPHVSLLVIGLLAAAFTFVPLGAAIDAMLITRIAVQFIGQIFALIWLRRNKPEMDRPFRMWMYPLPALLAIIGWVFLIVTQSVALLLYAAGFLGLGIASYYAWRTLSGRLAGNDAAA